MLAVPTAGFLVRLFMIQHDCGHGAFFHHRVANDWVGRVISVLTLTPYDFWRRTHAIHHATSGNLDRRGIGDVDTLTVHEYLALSRWRRLCYRVYRHPIHHVRFGPGLFVHRSTSAAIRPHACWLAALAQRHGDQRRHRSSHRHHDMASRHRPVRACASTDHTARGFDQSLAVLCPALQFEDTAWGVLAAKVFGAPAGGGEIKL
jgi:Fatty acid desaturase